MGGRSVDVLGHDCVKILKTDFSIFVAIGFLQHQFQSLVIQVFLDVVVHVLQVVQSQVIFVFPVVFFEHARDHLLVLVAVGLSIHGFHEFEETDTTSLFSIELGNDFVGGLSVGHKTVLRQQQFDIVGKQDSHTCGIVGVKNLLEIEDVIDGQRSCDVEGRFELSEIFASESDTVVVGSVDF